MRWLAILNPASGALGGGGRAETLAARLARDLDLRVVVSTVPGHAEALAREAADYDGILAIGGDGTAAEVVNGMDRVRQTLALLPTGTGNGLARDLGLPLPGRRRRVLDPNGPELALMRRVLRGGTVRAIDLVDVRFRRRQQDAWTTRLALGTTAVGYAAEVVALARGTLAPLSRRLPPGLCYPLGAALQALRQRPFDIHFALDDQPLAACRATNLMVHNTAHAGNFRAFPAAGLDDGLLDVLVADASPLAQLRHNLAVLRQTYGFATAGPRPAHSAALRSDAPLRLMLDGELVDGISEVRWALLPKVLRVALPFGTGDDAGSAAIAD